eukprot:16055435-Heterocapsa_arctica.AAC.1
MAHQTETRRPTAETACSCTNVRCDVPRRTRFDPDRGQTVAWRPCNRQACLCERVRDGRHLSDSSVAHGDSRRCRGACCRPP